MTQSIFNALTFQQTQRQIKRLSLISLTRLPKTHPRLHPSPTMFPWSEPPRPLRFDQFMAAALHDPRLGYYARRIRDVGPRGDFSTSATLSPALGRAIGCWASKALRESSCRNLIELGPGSGELAVAVLAGLPWHQRLRVRMHLVETSEPLRQKQAALLGKRVHWHHTASEALDACHGSACIYSNEFVDAFPVRRFKRQQGTWLEEFVSPGQSHWVPAQDMPSSSALHQAFGDDQIIEVHASYCEWLRNTLPHWETGQMLTIDYGSPVEELYHRRPDGSLRGYFHHQLVVGPELLERPGHQDLTADVNFTDLIEWSQPRLKKRSLVTQSEFLDPHLRAKSTADDFIADRNGAGDAFICLHQVVDPA